VRARVGGVPCTHGTLGQAFAFSLGLFPLGASMRLDELLPSRRHEIKKQKRHHTLTNENEEGGCARADSEGTNNEGNNTHKSLPTLKH